MLKLRDFKRLVKNTARQLIIDEEYMESVEDYYVVVYMKELNEVRLWVGEKGFIPVYFVDDDNAEVSLSETFNQDIEFYWNMPRLYEADMLDWNGNYRCPKLIVQDDMVFSSIAVQLYRDDGLPVFCAEKPWTRTFIPFQDNFRAIMRKSEMMRVLFPA